MVGKHDLNIDFTQYIIKKLPKKDFSKSRKLDWSQVTINPPQKREQDHLVGSDTKQYEHIQNLENTIPHLNWKNAINTPWKECVRDPKKQPKPISETEKNYYENNQDLRASLLIMFVDIQNGKINDLDNFKRRFSQLHKILILGRNGDNIYMKPDQKVKIRDKSPADIAGNYGKDMDLWNEKLADLLKRLQKFLNKNNFSKHSPEELIQQVGDIFFQNLNGYSPQFSYGWNSFNMNFTNALLKVVGSSGIPHGNLDIEFMCRLNEDKFPKKFANVINKSNKID